MDEKNNNKFEYSYSAPTEDERREIASIRRRYSPFSEDSKTGGAEGEGKLEKLRRLAGEPARIAATVSSIIGTVGTLIFGLGLSMVLEWDIILFGILTALPGIAMMALAYPIYRIIRRSAEARRRDEILALSDELLASEEK